MRANAEITNDGTPLLTSDRTTSSERVSPILMPFLEVLLERRRPDAFNSPEKSNCDRRNPRTRTVYRPQSQQTE